MKSPGGTLCGAPHSGACGNRKDRARRAITQGSNFSPPSFLADSSTMPHSRQRQHKRIRAYVAYKAVSGALFEPIQSKSLADIADWPLSERNRYHRYLLRGYIVNSLCHTRRQHFRDEFVPESLRDEEHEKAINRAKINSRVYESLLNQFAAGLRTIGVASVTETQQALEPNVGADDQPGKTEKKVTNKPSKVTKNVAKTRGPGEGAREREVDWKVDWEDLIKEVEAELDAKRDAMFDGLYGRLIDLIPEGESMPEDGFELELALELMVGGCHLWCHRTVLC
jgi:hypothetical protein